MSQDSDKRDGEPVEEPHAGTLVPFSGGIVEGLQAYRQGNAILYTVRGEPRDVQELMEQLDADGVDEVIALISHESRDDAPTDTELQKDSEEQNEE